jgi:hypothetical protein
MAPHLSAFAFGAGIAWGIWDLGFALHLLVPEQPADTRPRHDTKGI